MSQADELLNSLSADETTDITTEGHIIIDDNRFITVPEELKRIGVQFDHNVETVTFDCPRYWDGLDMSQMVVYINYMLPDGSRGSYLADNVAADNTDDTIMHFDWTISRNITQLKGTIRFLICVKKTDEDGNEVNHWNSELCNTMYVSEGLECEEVVVEDYPDIITSLLERMDNMENTINPVEEMPNAEECYVAQLGDIKLYVSSYELNRDRRYDFQNRVDGKLYFTDNGSYPAYLNLKGYVLRSECASPCAMFNTLMDNDTKFMLTMDGISFTEARLKNFSVVTDINLQVVKCEVLLCCDSYISETETSNEGLATTEEVVEEINNAEECYVAQLGDIKLYVSSYELNRDRRYDFQNRPDGKLYFTDNGSYPAYLNLKGYVLRSECASPCVIFNTLMDNNTRFMLTMDGIYFNAARLKNFSVVTDINSQRVICEILLCCDSYINGINEETEVE